MVACQEDADEDQDDIKDLIECELDPQLCTPAKRSLLEDRASGCKRKRQPSYLDDPNVAEQALGCDTTFLCDTVKWPNVCLNALSAQNLRGKPAHLTYYGERDKFGHDVTADWYNTHPNLGIAVRSFFVLKLLNTRQKANGWPRKKPRISAMQLKLVPLPLRGKIRYVTSDSSGSSLVL